MLAIYKVEFVDLSFIPHDGWQTGPRYFSVIDKNMKRKNNLFGLYNIYRVKRVRKFAILEKQIRLLFPYQKLRSDMPSL